LAKKHIKSEVKPLPTKRQLSRHRRQQRIQRIIYITGAVFLALLIAFVGYGYWNVQVKPFHQPAMRINGTTYDMDYYIKYLDLYSSGKDATQTATLANDMVNIIESSAAVRKAAPEIGVVVNNDEVSSALKTLALPDEQVYRDAITSTLLVTQSLQEYFDKQVPANDEQADTQALLVDNTDLATQLRTRLLAGDNFTSLASTYSLEPITKSYGGKLGWLPKGFTDVLLGSLGNSVLIDIPFTLNPGEISQPTFDGEVTKSLGFWVVQVTETDTTKGSHVRGILTASQHDAEEVGNKIIAGGDFATLAKDYSQDSASAANGGDLGWTEESVIRNRSVLGAAQNLKPGDVSQPIADTSVQTKGGYWLVKVVDRVEDRELDNNMRQTLKNVLFNKWITEKIKSDTVETLLTEDQKSWAINLVVKKRGK
jgi:parvulin-like peptidyl-prolyl isomerase